MSLNHWGMCLMDDYKTDVLLLGFAYILVPRKAASLTCSLQWCVALPQTWKQKSQPCAEFSETVSQSQYWLLISNEESPSTNGGHPPICWGPIEKNHREMRNGGLFLFLSLGWDVHLLLSSDTMAPGSTAPGQYVLGFLGQQALG